VSVKHSVWNLGYFGSFLGLRGSKNENFEKKISDLKRASKITYKTYVTSLKKKISKNTKFWEFLRCGSPGQEKPSGDLKMAIFSLKPKVWEVTWFFSTYLYLKTHPQICFNNNFDILSFLYLLPRGWGNSETLGLYIYYVITKGRGRVWRIPIFIMFTL